MKSFNFLIRVVFLSLLTLTACSDKKPDTGTNSIKTTSKSSSKKNSKKENNKPTKVKLEASISGQQITFSNQINQNAVVSLLRNGIMFKYSDSENKEILVNLSGPDFYNKIPIIFKNQIQSMKTEDQVSTDIFKSRMYIYLPSKTGQPSDAKKLILYKGTVILKKFTENIIEVDFDGTGFPPMDPKLKHQIL